jgi:hypothetical protein
MFFLFIWNHMILPFRAGGFPLRWLHENHANKLGVAAELIYPIKTYLRRQKDKYDSQKSTNILT